MIYGKPCEDYQEQLSRFETKVVIGKTIFTSFPALGTKLIYILTIKVY